MSSFTVFYEGQKKSVKLANANVLLQQVVVEAAEHFQLNPADCSLRHKGKTVDISMPLRFCTFPNNAALDLIVNRRSATTGTGPASKVALSVSAGDQTLNLSAVLSSSNSLKDMIAYFVEKNQLAGDILAGRFELIYMRSCFNSLDALQSTTLASLGLAGQAARFQLRILDAIPFAKSQSTASSSSSSANAGAEVVPILPPAATPAATPTSPLATEPATDHQSPTTMALPIPPLSSMNHISAVASEAAVDPHEMEVEEQSEVTEVLSPKDSIALLLSTNFDVATKPAITTLYKYIANISYYPHEEKYKTINTANKVFLDKVAPARNIEQVFLAFGFEKIVSGHWKLIEASKEVNAVERRINEALTAINNAMDELQIPEEERPKVNPPVVQSSTPFEFDPFKSLLVRNAIQPTRDISTTDIKLEQLQKRRRELEGSPEMVQRETEVRLFLLLAFLSFLLLIFSLIYIYIQAVFPAGPSSSSNSASTVLENGSSSDAGGVSKSIMQKILKGEEEAPLTTKAVRDLQKAQTERIHSRTLIRIR